MRDLNGSCILTKQPLYSYGSELVVDNGDLESRIEEINRLVLSTKTQFEDSQVLVFPKHYAVFDLRIRDTNFSPSESAANHQNMKLQELAAYLQISNAAKDQ